MTDTTYPEPNEISDRYEATKNLRDILTRIVDSMDEVERDGESSHPLSEYHEGVKDMLDYLGSAQVDLNDFTMDQYREMHEDLPTLETRSFFCERELSVLVGMGAVGPEEEVQLPVDASGERLPLFVKSSEEVGGAMETLERYRDSVPERSVKTLHVADTHLGFSRRYTGESSGKTPPWKVDCVGAFEEVVGIAKREGVDSVVHAGDVFDHNVSEEHLQTFEALVEELDEAGISFRFVVGNHGALSTGKEGANAMETMMSISERDNVDLLSREPSVLGDGIVCLYGLGHVGLGAKDWDSDSGDWNYDNWDESWWDDPDLRFERGSEATHHVLCVHGSFEKDGKHMPAGELVEETNIEFDRLLLGDRHEPVDGVGGCEDAYYSGPTQRLTEGKKFEPSVNVFEFYEEGEVTLKRVPLA